MNKNIAIIGGGPAGLMCAIIAKRTNPQLNIVIYEKNDIGATLLPTGGGRCNLSHYSDDIKEFTQNYLRGEKFLYSVFNQFFIPDTINFFNSIGVKTYIQEDERLFPLTNKSLDVIFALKNEIKKLNINIEKKEIKNYSMFKDMFYINGRTFDKIVISTGGRKTELFESLKISGHDILEQKPALSSLKINETEFSQISGVSLKNANTTIQYENKKLKLNEDLLFTHKGISGPLAYKISSIFSRENYSKDNPIKIEIDFIGKDENLQMILDKNSHKEIINIINLYMPKSLSKLLLDKNEIECTKQCHKINKEERLKIEKFLRNFSLTIISPLAGGEIVSSGGIDLKNINPKTLESKIIPNLFFCGEVMDIDGYCGGYNLQNCWSTGYIAGINIAK